MAYKIEEIVTNSGGQDRIKYLVEKECYTYDMLKELFNTPKMSRPIVKRILNYCSAKVPYPRLTMENRKWLVEWDYVNGNYWESQFIRNILLKRLSNPTINKSGKHFRYVVNCNKHPRASKSNQVKAHIILWELHNNKYLPKGEEVSPLDGDFTNLDIDNWIITTETFRKSKNTSGSNNYFYTGKPRHINYTRGWKRISEEVRNYIGHCEACNNTNNLNTHHIISYHLFDEENTKVHCKDNLLVLCDSCHGKVHSYKLAIKPLISEMRYRKLLELLENLKSQVSDSLMETYREVEKQLGLTDNQQPSP